MKNTRNVSIGGAWYRLAGVTVWIYGHISCGSRAAMHRFVTSL
jgi:hypothetical protein